MTLQTGSKQTSVSGNRIVPFLRAPVEIDAAATSVRVEPRVRATSVQPGAHDLSCKSMPYTAGIIISSPAEMLVIDASSNHIDYSMFFADTYRFFEERTRSSVCAGGYVPTAGYMPTFVEGPEAEILRGLSELRSIVQTIQIGGALQFSPEFEDLLGRAVAAQGVPADIDLWARRLAEDVGDIDD